MERVFIVNIGYQDYAVPMQDAAILIDIASRCFPVTQDNYSGPYFRKETGKGDTGTFLDTMRVAIVEARKAELPTGSEPALAAIPAPVKRITHDDDEIVF